MSAVPSKPGQRHSVSDWLRNNQELVAAAQSQRLASAAIRQEGRSLRNETDCRVGICSFHGATQAPPCFCLPSADGLG